MATLDRHGGTGRRSAWTSRAAARTQRGRRHWLIGVAVVAAILVPLSMSGVSSAADDTPRPQGAGPDGISTMAIELGPPITRSEIIARADTWMHPPVPYNQDANKDGYRTDCSGYVSMAWKLPQNLWTGNLDQVGVPIGYNDLKAGDMLLYHNLADPVNGSHVVLFERWTGAVGGDFYIYEQSPPATKHRLWSQAGYSRSLFKPFRYKNTVEDSLGNGLSSVVYGGVLRFFGRGMDGQLIQYYQDSGGVWAWQALGGNILGTPGAVVDGTVLRVFASGTDGTPFQYYFDGAWHLASIGVGRISSGTSAVRYGGMTRFFARGMDGQLIQYYQDSGGVWAWQALGGNILGTPGAVFDGTVLRVFVSGTDGTPFQYYFDGTWHRHQRGPLRWHHPLLRPRHGRPAHPVLGPRRRAVDLAGTGRQHPGYTRRSRRRHHATGVRGRYRRHTLAVLLHRRPVVHDRPQPRTAHLTG